MSGTCVRITTTRPRRKVKRLGLVLAKIWLSTLKTCVNGRGGACVCMCVKVNVFLFDTSVCKAEAVLRVYTMACCCWRSRRSPGQWLFKNGFPPLLSVKATMPTVATIMYYTVLWSPVREYAFNKVSTILQQFQLEF